MRKKVLSWILTIAIVSMLFVGCGSSDEQQGTGGAEITQANQSDEAEETTEAEQNQMTEEVTETSAETPEATDAETVDIESLAEEIAAELGLDEELSGQLLEELQITWEVFQDDPEKYAEVVEGVKEEFAHIAEKKSEAATAEPEEIINWDMANIPEDRAWVDDLYNKLIADDYQAVMAILADDAIAEKAEPYKYISYVYDAYGYKLVTTDGKIVGLQLPKDMTSGGTRAAFFSESEESNYGFNDIGHGDHCVMMWTDAFGAQTYEWFDGTTIHYADGSTYDLEKNEVYIVWAM